MINKKVYIPFFLLLFFFSFNHQAKAEMNDGILDLRSVSLTREAVPLKGDWEFYWNELWTPVDFHDSSKLSKKYIEAPNIWSKAKYSGPEKLTNNGFGTYRMKIKLNKEDSTKLMGLYIPSVASAYKLWVDGELLAYNGVVGKDRESMKPKSFSQVASFIPKTNEIEIIMQVSNFSQRKGGMWDSIQFGYDQVISKQRELYFIQEIIIASALLALGIYLLSLYLFKATTTLPLFLGAFCLLVSLRTLLVGEVLLIYLLPNFPWEWSVKLEYLSFYFGIMLVIIYLYKLFPDEMNNRIVHFSTIVCGLFSLTTFLPAYIYTQFLLTFEIFLVFLFAFCIHTVVFAFIRKREGAFLNLLSVFFFIFAVIHDIFYYNFWIHSFDLAPIAAGTFLFVQTLIVAKKSSHAFSQVEKLSQEIQKTNALLEKKVEERTRELQEKNNKLLQIEQTRKAFFSSVAHEIGTPMQAIQGYIQLLQNKIHPEKQEQYYTIIYEKTRLLTHLSKDLLDLAKLDEGQFDFHLEEIDALFLLEHLYHRFKLDVERAEVNFDYIPPTNIPNGKIPLIRVDIFRMEQVFSNIINNATKHTLPGGKIQIKGEYKEGNPKMLHFEISDNGKGMD